MTRKRRDIYKKYYERDVPIPKSTRHLLEKRGCEEICDDNFRNGKGRKKLCTDRQTQENNSGNTSCSKPSPNVPLNKPQYSFDFEIDDQRMPTVEVLQEFMDHPGYVQDLFLGDESEDEDMENCEQELGNDGPTNYSNLYKFLEDKNSNSILDASLVVSECEIMMGILEFASHASLDNDNISNLCKLINSFFNKRIVPDTRYMMDKLLTTEDGREYHAVCPDCNSYIQKFNRGTRSIQCKKCERFVSVTENDVNFFLILKIDDQIRNLVQQNVEYVEHVLNNRDVNDSLKDIYYGALYKKFLSSLPFESRNSHASFTFNSDGSPVFKSSSFSITPIQVILNELPVDVRNSNPLTVGLWFSKKKPNMKIFLDEFVKDMTRLSTDGITFKIRDEERNIKFHAICCCVDSIARPPMQGIVQFNGYYGCSWCLHPGVPVKHNTRHVIKYPLLNNVPPLRNESQTLDHLEEVLDTGTSSHGMKAISPLTELSRFDIVRGFVLDTMHCVFLGVCRQFAKYWFDSSRKPFSIKKEDKTKISKILKSIKVPNQISRLPRPLEDRKDWKSREWENFLLFFILPILEQIENFEVYWDHFRLLVNAMHILMSSDITMHALLHANSLLKEFVGKTQMLYTKKAMTYNIHQLLHICQSVIYWGPLWSHFGYAFESGNGKILDFIKASKGVLFQICRRLNYQQCSSILQTHVLSKNQESPVLEYCNRLQNRSTQKTDKLTDIRYFGSPSAVNYNLMRNLGLSDFAESYNRISKNNCIFSSCNKTYPRSSNCYAKTCDGSFVKIIEFIYDHVTGKELTICNEIITINGDRYDAIKVVRDISGVETVIPSGNSSISNMYHY